MTGRPGAGATGAGATGAETVRRLGRSRAHVLEALQAAEGPLDASELAALVGLHPNTTRFHLDALVATGFAGRSAERRRHAGRPRVLYAATPDSPAAGRRNYQLLAEILAGHLAGTSRHPASAATGAGRAWGHYLARRPAPYEVVDEHAATDQVMGVLDEIGFEPELSTGRGHTEILLRHCPFRELARTHAQVVCSVHLGVVQGLLADLDAPITARRIRPFLDATSCSVELVPRSRRPRPAPPAGG